MFSSAGAAPLTYAQAGRRIPPLVAARSYQIPYFQGDLGGAVFGNTKRTQPIGWEVIAIGPSIKLGGPPLPGIGKGAELRVYDGSVKGADARDPGKAKSTLVIDEMTGVNASAHVAAARPGGPHRWPKATWPFRCVPPMRHSRSRSVCVPGVKRAGGSPKNRLARCVTRSSRTRMPGWWSP